MDYETLILEQDGDVATVTLNRPESLNSLDATLRQEILDVCERLKNDDGVRAVVFTGAGRGFCSGAHVGGGARQDEQPDWNTMKDEYGWVGRQAMAVYHIDKPTIAAVNGVAAGAGMSLALACDMRVGSAQSRFKTVFIERALSPDAGMSYFLPRLIGQGNALDLILTSRAVDGEEAYRLGLLQRFVEHERLLEESQEVARTIAAHPPLAAQMSKRAIQHSLDAEFERQLRYETRAISLARNAKEDVAGVGACVRGEAEAGVPAGAEVLRRATRARAVPVLRSPRHAIPRGDPTVPELTMGRTLLDNAQWPTLAHDYCVRVRTCETARTGLAASGDSRLDEDEQAVARGSSTPRGEPADGLRTLARLRDGTERLALALSGLTRMDQLLAAGNLWTRWRRAHHRAGAALFAVTTRAGIAEFDAHVA
ncbi:MAG: enoyl-CoA hydratase/isomerase family protein [Dehalococcoidia bacterium]|nr:enoyl-CoA hydratase/isomerase family protein [Dehalococcoidia bacterium]